MLRTLFFFLFVFTDPQNVVSCHSARKAGRLRWRAVPPLAPCGSSPISSKLVSSVQAPQSGENSRKSESFTVSFTSVISCVFNPREWLCTFLHCGLLYRCHTIWFFIRTSLVHFSRTTLGPNILAGAGTIDLNIQFLLFWMPSVNLPGWWLNKPMPFLFDQGFLRLMV